MRLLRGVCTGSWNEACARRATYLMLVNNICGAGGTLYPIDNIKSCKKENFTGGVIQSSKIWFSSPPEKNRYLRSRFSSLPKTLVLIQYIADLDLTAGPQ